MLTDGDTLFVFEGQNVFLLDLTRRQAAQNDPYTRYVYEAYVWTLPVGGVPCVTADGVGLWREDELYLFDETIARDEIREDGNIIRSAIAARWETHPMKGAGPHACTRFFALTAETEGGTALRIGVKDGEQTRLLRDYDGRLGAFRYARVYYGQWCYRVRGERTARFPLPLRHQKGAALTLENDVTDQPLTLISVTAEYK